MTHDRFGVGFGILLVVNPPITLPPSFADTTLYYHINHLAEKFSAPTLDVISILCAKTLRSRNLSVSRLSD